ncbi:hypothetical protein JQX08_10255 [Pseudomonas sp. UL073]|uniref:Uncharacterized protein n=1 Tax=Zestomonas insulae TaxID=2809017 RepID=A0ABS2IGK8_9GAMM|nr:hypothetical protein [Pseudomonas insulae]MBM7061087.1 hypothetical protein [Pseudomonas insulae]
MHGSALEDGRHSTPETPRPQLGWRFFATLALLGVLLGLMIGRLANPEPARLERIEVAADRLLLWFDHEPEALRGDFVQGALVLGVTAQGAPARGQLQVAGKVANWRLVRSGEESLRLELVSARPLRGEWHGVAAEGRWRLEIRLRPE